MAKGLKFIKNGKAYNLYPVKVERKKLYGWSETIYQDDDGEELKVAYLDDTGTVIIPKGSINSGMLDDCNNWIERNQLKAFDGEGNQLDINKSSFSIDIELNVEASEDEVLEYSIDSFYQLEKNDEENENLTDVIGDKIYKFNFNYRDGFNEKTAFLLKSGENLFVIVGLKNEYEYISLDEVSNIDEVDETEDEEMDLDFDMM
jgi:hypothetical protein